MADDAGLFGVLYTVTNTAAKTVCGVEDLYNLDEENYDTLQQNFS